MARWKYVVLGVVGVPVLVMVLLVGWVWAAFSGGVDDLLDFDQPEPTDPEVVAAEREAEVEYGGASDDVVATIGQALAPAGLVEVGGGVEPGRCAVGQHNFKIDDDFDLSCELRGVELVAAPAAPAEATTTRRVDAALQAAGWTPQGLYDVEEQLRHSPSAGVADLMPLRYTRQRDGVTWRLVVDEADLSGMTYELRGLDRLRDPSGRPVSVEELVAAMPRDGYALAVGVSVEYFRE